MKNSIVFLCPYFGTINKSQFSLWMKCCRKNEDIDFLFITDDDVVFEVERPENVKLIRMSWEECKELIQSRFDFKVSMAYAYKLCDLKPAYGSIFAEYIDGYDFWGHIDFSDTILGELRSFITDDILNEFDKIHIYGHLTLYRNTAENNERFRIPAECGITIEELFSREEVTGFDEMYNNPSINRIFKENGFALLEGVDNLVADVLPHDWRFRLAQDEEKRVSRVFECNDGKLYELSATDGEVSKREIGYVHFQKRKVCNKTSADTKHFYFVPNEFIDADHELTADEIIEYSKDKLYLDPLKGRISRIKWYAKHPSAFMRKLKEKLG